MCYICTIYVFINGPPPTPSYFPRRPNALSLTQTVNDFSNVALSFSPPLYPLTRLFRKKWSFIISHPLVQSNIHISSCSCLLSLLLLLLSLFMCHFVLLSLLALSISISTISISHPTPTPHSHLRKATTISFLPTITPRPRLSISIYQKKSLVFFFSLNSSCAYQSLSQISQFHFRKSASAVLHTWSKFY